MTLLAVFILLIALLITALLFSRQSKPDFSQSDTPIYDELAYERGFTKWDV